ncbi:sigma-54-dependent Fis family transcriptional regulator [Acidithiobacillus marinus]|uniref:Sigma-54-dependent Fis family transcriptional regulator n=1 Tax=Acidithiobacillus marinus TaxID=187490 RepID=A0A2I1DPW3_9PROT|nr:sigma-54 dependent transcriptional regulator [Acidithiobacillus marinus]PKY11900.1 sigma-54-dependent Fis family transcriptional regulator [Acidithiobacillus marinus]
MTTSRSVPSALVVDDEPNIVELLRITLEGMGLEVSGAHSLAEAQARLATGLPSLVLSDLRLPDGSGIDLVRHLHEQHPQLPVAVITAYSSADGAVEAMQAGAFDYMSKPIELARLRHLVAAAIKLNNPQNLEHDATDRLVGHSPLMQQIREDIRKLARSNAPVHITGESGTGKELVARAIHDSSLRHDQPFVAVNCGAIPEGLIESELFGAEKGAYSGATQARQGLFQAANGGTLFLDEIGDLPMLMQVKLLRAIQERVIRPLGGSREISLDLRFISATHRDLGAMVDAGTFRQDLLYRLNVVQLHLPPLRERREDIPQLVDVILQRMSGPGRGSPATPTEEVMHKLLEYDFPGNVRELENLLERSLVFPDKNILESEKTPAPCLNEEQSPALRVTRGESGVARALDDAEAALLRSMLEVAAGDAAVAAQQLGISPQSFALRVARSSAGSLE